jgi:2-C-methyl-D-erythritol 4-phosphate cytidylyltransferase
MPKFAVIIPAAGKSSRFAGPQKKPFMALDGKPLWQRAGDLFWNRNDVLKVYLVIAPEDRDEFRGRFGHLIAFVNCEVVDGGAERFESVANALKIVPEECEYVAIHDAVRPLVSSFQVDAVFQAAVKTGAAILALPVADTLKVVENGNVTGTVPREKLWQAQTPQVFRRDWLVEAYSRRDGNVTDDATLLESLGHKVSVVNGSAFNFKITTKDDLALAEAVMKSRKQPGSGSKQKMSFFDDEPKWD